MAPETYTHFKVLSHTFLFLVNLNLGRFQMYCIPIRPLFSVYNIPLITCTLAFCSLNLAEVIYELLPVCFVLLSTNL